MAFVVALNTDTGNVDMIAFTMHINRKFGWHAFFSNRLFRGGTRGSIGNKASGQSAASRSVRNLRPISGEHGVKVSTSSSDFASAPIRHVSFPVQVLTNPLGEHRSLLRYQSPDVAMPH